jgi:hypothetical protein
MIRTTFLKLMADSGIDPLAAESAWECCAGDLEQREITPGDFERAMMWASMTMLVVDYLEDGDADDFELPRVRCADARFDFDVN